MTVQAQAAAAVYTGDGVTVAFVIPFEMRSGNDLQVYYDRVLQAPTHQITGDVTVPGATVTFTLPPAVGVEILLARATPLSQDTIYTAHGSYKAKQHEADFDKLMMIAQELRNRIDDPPEGIYAEDVIFAPFGSIESENVQDAIEELAGDAFDTAVALTKAIAEAVKTRALITTQIISQDPDVLQILNPTLADDITLVPKSNIPFGLLKLDGSGHIPTDLLPATGTNFVGIWSPTVNGPTPPAGVHGDMYIFNADGEMTLLESTNTTPHTVDVFTNDYMVYDTVGVDGWYYVHAAQQQIITAAGVLFVPVGTIGSINVQLAIAELDASISQRFLEEGDEISIYRFNGITNEVVLRSYADGIRLFINSRDVLATFAAGLLVYGANQSDSFAQNSQVAFRTIDGVGLGRVGFLGDNALYLINDKPGGVMRIGITGAAGDFQALMIGSADAGTAFFEHGKGRMALNPNSMTLYSDNVAADIAPVCILYGQTSDGGPLFRLGFLGSNTLQLVVDKPGGDFRLQLGTSFKDYVTLSSTGVTVGGNLAVQGGATAKDAPTLANHLTRKDYVDNLVASSGAFASAATPVTANFSVPHGLGVRPGQIWALLVCDVANAGYAVGDVIDLPLPYNVTVPISGAIVSFGYGIWADALSVGFTRASAPPNIVPKGGGSMTPLVEANWSVVLRARR